MVAVPAADAQLAAANVDALSVAASPAAAVSVAATPGGCFYRDSFSSYDCCFLAAAPAPVLAAPMAAAPASCICVQFFTLIFKKPAGNLLRLDELDLSMHVNKTPILGI